MRSTCTRTSRSTSGLQHRVEGARVGPALDAIQHSDEVWLSLSLGRRSKRRGVLPRRDRKGSLGLLVAVALSLVLFGADPAFAAQPEIRSAEECARSRTAAEELACLRAALQAWETGKPRDTSGEASSEAALHRDAVTRHRPSLGEEQAAVRRSADAQPNDTLIAMIARSDVDDLGRLTVWLDNGQVWRQAETEALPLQLSSDPIEVEISRSGFGGYRMRLPDLRRRVAVRRIN